MFADIALAAVALTRDRVPAHAEPREVLRVCQAVIERADAIGAGRERSETRRRRDHALPAVIRDWTLRESRMSVDEDGRPLR